MPDTTNHAEIIRHALRASDLSNTTYEGAVAALDALTRELEETKAKVAPSEFGSATYEELWHESNASYYAEQAENAAQSERIAELESFAFFVVDHSSEPEIVANAKRVIEPDLSKCPKCGGPADNGHDRCVPPSPYFCTKCNPKEAP